MFTGIITHLGTLEQKTPSTLKIKASPDIVQHLTDGMSISTNGICLTVTKRLDNETFCIDYMPETEEKTNIKYLNTGDKINLELPATPNTFLAGHIVQGHVDFVSEVLEIRPDGNSHIFKFKIPVNTNKHIVDKGSITVNGISLTVIKVTAEYFTVGIIPHTWTNTMLYETKVGNFVNIELDVLAKYLEKLVKP